MPKFHLKTNNLKLITCSIIFTASFLLFTVYCLLSTVSAEDNTCISCHRGYEGKIGDPVKQWETSIHKEKGITCEKCHGGDPNSFENSMSPNKGFIGVPSPLKIPQLCAKCHANQSYMRQFNQRTDQFDLYKTSQHGKLLFEKKDTKVATCVNCHGTHDIKSKSHPLSSVYRTNVPATCAKCHADAEYMKKYNIPTNQFELYNKSYHGQLLLEKNDLRPANCADCHGTHGAVPPGVNEIANVCGNCHGTTEGYYNEGGHKKAVADVGVPRCIDCHGNHNIIYPNLEMFSGNETGHCGSCHDTASLEYVRGQKIKELINLSDEKIHKFTKETEKLRKTGIDLSLLEEQIKEAQAKIVEAIPITHSLSFDKVEAKIKEAGKITDEINNLVKKIKDEASRRKFALIIVFIAIFAFIVVLYQKLKEVSQ